LKKAYSSVVPHQKCFVGWYVDVSALNSAKDHSITVELPQLKPGQFQGVFFENVEPEYTRSLISM